MRLPNANPTGWESPGQGRWGRLTTRWKWQDPLLPQQAAFYMRPQPLCQEHPPAHPGHSALQAGHRPTHPCIPALYQPHGPQPVS